ncbi:LOW QUALITY PROTEIN: MAM33 domain-containing protein, partial [Cephalotus follicularis]
MPRAAPVLRKALKDLNLLKVLQSEINYELSSNLFQNEQIGSLGDFTVDWDAPETQDVFLLRKCEWGEDVAVSALLGPETFTEGVKFPREVLMKVCVKKSGLSLLLQFDCLLQKVLGSEFDIYNAYYLQLSTCLVPSVYRGPLFSELDPQFQDALKDYLISRGVGESLTNFLLHHLHKKEQGQYVNWLHNLKSLV